MKRSKVEHWGMCRECRHLFKLDADPERQMAQVVARLCPMHAEVSRVELVAVLARIRERYGIDPLADTRWA